MGKNWARISILLKVLSSTFKRLTPEDGNLVFIATLAAPQGIGGYEVLLKFMQLALLLIPVKYQ